MSLKVSSPKGPLAGILPGCAGTGAPRDGTVGACGTVGVLPGGTGTVGSCGAGDLPGVGAGACGTVGACGAGDLAGAGACGAGDLPGVGAGACGAAGAPPGKLPAAALDASIILL